MDAWIELSARVKASVTVAIMGGSSPPFLYGSQSAYNFYGPTDRPFNPKAVTQASWTRPQPKPKPKGPLVNFNRHPDSVSNGSLMSRCPGS